MTLGSNMAARQRRLLILIAVLIPAFGGCNRAPKVGDLTFEPHIFETHDGQRINATLGRLVVPESWQKPAPQLDASFRSPLASDVPALFISGTLDVRTPPSNAEEIRKGFSNSTLVVVDGAAHSDQLLIASPLISKVMLEFMKGLPVSTEKIEAPFEFEAA